jgi:uncharacterized MAPEG superfamily protein
LDDTGAHCRRRAATLGGGIAGPGGPDEHSGRCAARQRTVPARDARSCNCLENLPVFAAIVLVGSVTGLNSPGMDALAVMTMGARVAQMSVHMLLSERNATIAVRFAFFLVQVLAMSSMGFLLARAAIRHVTDEARPASSVGNRAIPISHPRAFSTTAHTSAYSIVGCKP